MCDCETCLGLRRREFMVGGAAAVAAIAAIPSAPAFAKTEKRPDVRKLGFKNLHTGENVSVTYHANGKYVLEGLDELDSVMRDVRNDDIKRMNPKLFDLLHDLKRAFDSKEDYLLISGFRSQETNDFLRSLGRGVAKRSYHIRGMAADVRLPGVDVVEFAKAAKAMKRGGVGLYRRSRFVHLDVARPRSWNF